MSSFNDALVYHWPFPLKDSPRQSKRDTAYRLGVKYPNSRLEVDSTKPNVATKQHGRGQQWSRPKSLPSSTALTPRPSVTEKSHRVSLEQCGTTLRYKHCSKILGAIAVQNLSASTSPLCAGSSLKFSCLSRDSLRELAAPTSFTRKPTKPSPFGSPTYCPMNPYRMAHVSSLSSTRLLVSLKRQQDLIQQLSSRDWTSLAVTAEKFGSHDATTPEQKHVPSSVASTSMQSLRTSPSRSHAPCRQKLHSHSEVLQLPPVNSTVAIVTPPSNTRHSKHTAVTVKCKKKTAEPARYPDPFKSSNRLYKKRLSELASLVTDTLMWEKSRQQQHQKKQRQGSNSTLL